MYTKFICMLVFCAVIYFWLRHHFDFWQRRQVPEIRPSLMVGNMGSLLCIKKSCAEFIRELYNHPEAVNKPFVGIHIFHTPALLVRDPELIKRILIRDFTKFSNRYSNSDSKGDPMGSQNIFFLKNPVWKEIRLQLTPFFTGGRLKNMFPLINQVGCNMDSFLMNQSLDNCDKSNKFFTLEMKEFCAWYTTDVIATVAYGVEANTFKNPNGDFRRNGRQIFKFSTKRAIEFTIVFFLPHLMPYLGFKVVPSGATEFLRSTINYVITERERSGQFRNDLIDILIKFKYHTKQQQQCKKKSFVFDGDILVAQAAIFFTAGFESSSSTMAFALYELAKHPHLQERLREEVRQALIKCDNHISQSVIDSLQYMQMIIDEVLRMYPPLPFLDRECTMKETASYSLKPFHDFTIPHGMPVYIPVFGLHRDPKFFPNPDCFDPERFSKDGRKKLTPYTYIPFGLGPHSCIGERFAMLQTKIGLLHFFRNHRVALGVKSHSEMILDPKAIIVQALNGIYVDVVRDPIMFDQTMHI